MIAKLETEGGCKILRASGRIDFESALDFEQQINAMIQQGGDCFIIELSEVELLSSAGLRVLLSTAKRVSHRDALLGLAAPSQVVCQVFEISHFNLLFKIFPTVAEAIAALKGPSHSAKPVSPAPVPPGIPATAERAPSAEGEPPPVPEPRISVGEKTLRQEQAPAVSAQTPSTGRPSPSGSDRTAPVGKQESIPEQSAPVPPPLPAAKTSSARIPPVPAAETVPPLAPAPPIAKFPPPVPEGVQSTSRPPKLPPSEVAKPKPPQDTPGARQKSEPPLSGAATAAPVTRPPQPPPIRRVAGTPPRVEASFPAQLEVRAEGNSYPCKDGDVIGGLGQLGKAYFSQIPGLAPRHLLIGKAEGRWFVLTPKNVLHPFSIDGHPLIAGQRKFLEYTEHQLEFNGHVFGLRLIPEQKKPGFFSRIFGKK
jgi:anti-anti-sigma factor